MTPVGYLDTNVLYCDDNLKRLSQFPADCIDLIYLDPPFFSNRNYEVIWGDEAEVRSFEDRWEGGILVYVEWMRERLMEIHRILKPDGSVYLHCDWHASHYLKVVMDDVFGRDHFQNEVVWSYRTGGVSKKRWARKHDVLLFYSKSNEWQFTPLQERIYYDKAFFTEQKDAEGRYYADVYMRDVWDIPAVINVSKERLGYPTQKPEELLARVITASSEKGDIVLDPFCGCGTTLVAAERLGRKWIGIDISPTAVGLMKRRLEAIGAAQIKLVGMPVTEAQLRALKPFEFQNWVIQRMNGTHSPRKSGDMGIDGFSFFEHLPIQVKQSGVGRPTVDAFQTAVDRTGKKKGYIVGFSFSKDAHEEVARVKAAGITIELVSVDDLLKDATNVVTPQAGLFTTDLPLPEARTPDARPSVEELIESEQNGGAPEELAKAAETPAPYGDPDSN